MFFLFFHSRYYLTRFLKLLPVLVTALALASCQLAESPETASEAPPVTEVVSTQAPPSPAPKVKEQESEPLPVPVTELWQRIALGLELQEFYDHPQVLAQLENYGNNQAYFDLVAERARPFLYSIVEEIESRGLPMELALLPMVESTFNPNAYSAEHAVGLWQFVGATADSFGLQRDWWYDGRRDPIASTRAALDYLELLYQQFEEDWLLALAAYNTGDGNVRRAIRRHGGQQPSYWDLGLPRETRFHVPKLLALAAVVSGRGQEELELPPIPNLEVTASVPLEFQLDLATAARLMGLEAQQLRRLNPGYLQWATHPDNPQSLLVPLASVDALLTQVALLPPEERVSWDSYRIQPGDTLIGFARKLDTRVDILRTVNSITGSRIIAGDTLLIPRIDNIGLLNQIALPEQARRTSQPVPRQYRVRSGDNLWSIARRYDLHSEDIARHNNIELDGLLMPGQILNFSFASGGTAE